MCSAGRVKSYQRICNSNKKLKQEAITLLFALKSVEKMHKNVTVIKGSTISHRKVTTTITKTIAKAACLHFASLTVTITSTVTRFRATGQKYVVFFRN